MSTLNLSIETGNEDMQDGTDLAWALTLVADRLREGRTAGVIRDGNGNRVGQWEIS